MRTIILTGFSVFLTASATSAGAAPAAPVPVSVYGSSNVREFLAACHSDQGACMDEIGTALMDKMDYSGSSNVCLASVDYGTAVPKWLDSRPETATMPMEDGIYQAIKALYPCA